MTVDHAALEPYTPDGYTAALQQAIEQLAPRAVLLPHTYQTRDFAPTLAARLDPRAHHRRDGDQERGRARRRSSRPMFQGKLTADVVPLGPDPALRHVSDRRVPRRPGGKRSGAPRQ